MKGNIYISVPQADISNELPAAITRYDWTESTYNEEGEVESSTTIHPTWEQFGERNQGLFGSPVAVGDVVVYEMEASWLEGEVSALLALGNGQAAPNYTVHTNAEVRAFIQENTPSEI